MGLVADGDGILLYVMLKLHLTPYAGRIIVRGKGILDPYKEAKPWKSSLSPRYSGYSTLWQRGWERTAVMGTTGSSTDAYEREPAGASRGAIGPRFDRVLAYSKPTRLALHAAVLDVVDTRLVRDPTRLG